MKYIFDLLNNTDTSSVIKVNLDSNCESKLNLNIIDSSSNVSSSLNDIVFVNSDEELEIIKWIKSIDWEKFDPNWLPPFDGLRGDFLDWFFGTDAFGGIATEWDVLPMLPRHELFQGAELYPIFVFFIIAVILAAIILGASIFLGVQKPDTEKLSIYECGFDPYEDSRNKFDVRFYIIAILFIIFDLETVFCFPWIASLGPADPLGFWAMMDFLLELIVGFAYVWCVGALVWE